MSRDQSNRSARGWRVSLLLALLLTVTLADAKPPAWKKLVKPRPKPPGRLIATWSDAVLNTAGRRSTRGFAGRVMFYETEGDKPIVVNGSVTVYAYLDGTEQDEHVVPVRKYVFPAEKFQEHYSEGNLGPSYSLWLPWDEVGGIQQQVSLIARFDGPEQATIVSESTRHVLPGRPAPANLVGTRPPGHPQRAPEVRQLSHTAPVSAPPAPLSAAPTQRMSTSTISVPNSWAQRQASPRTNLATAMQQSRMAGPPAGVQAPQPLPPVMAQGAQVQAQVPAAPLPAPAPAAAPTLGFDSRFAQPRALGAPIARLRPAIDGKRPHHPGWPSGHEPSPLSPVAPGVAPWPNGGAAPSPPPIAGP